ncbi:MAG: hypothetical protein IIV45_11920 [Lachnospiraceae bacterium]|nr:hypothetical protein [Lachnospiraceae bacterium]
MKILLIIAGLFTFAGVNACFIRKITCDFGANIGHKYMKEQWGIDTE